MSGIRQTRGVTCSQCGMQGVVELGMGTVKALDESRDFACPTCGNIVNVQAPRAILDVKWHAVTMSETSQPAHGTTPY